MEFQTHAEPNTIVVSRQALDSLTEASKRIEISTGFSPEIDLKTGARIGESDLWQFSV